MENPQIATNADSRKCTATTKSGDPCPSWAIRGEKLCAGHAGIGGLDSVRAGLASGAARRARAEERSRTALDWAAKKLEEHGEELARLIVEAAQRGDWRAAAFLYERVHGKPVERVTQTQAQDPAGIAAMQPEERRAMLARLLEERPELRAVVDATRTPNEHPKADTA